MQNEQQKRRGSMVKRYEVRYFSSPSSFSARVGRKGRLLTFRCAQAVVSRLVKRGVDAVISAPICVYLPAPKVAQ